MSARSAILAAVSDPNERDLSLRQLLTLIEACALEQKDRTVRGLALKFNISKPAITRAADRLSEFGYITRSIDPQDRRSTFLNPTKTGRGFVEWFLGESEKPEAKAASAPAAKTKRAA